MKSRFLKIAQAILAGLVVLAVADTSEVKTSAPLRGWTLYLGSGPGNPWVALGVLEAVERFRVPISEVIGSGHGAWVAALWAHGYRAAQINAWLEQMGIYGPRHLEVSPAREEVAPEWIVDNGIPVLRWRWVFTGDSARPFHFWTPSPRRADYISRMAGLEAAGISLGTQSARIPWRVLACDLERVELALSAENPRWDWVMSALRATGRRVGNQTLVAMEECATMPDRRVLPQLDSGFVMVVSGWPWRMDGAAAVSARHAVQSWRAEYPVLHVEAHAARPDSAGRGDYWRRLGYESMRSRLGEASRRKGGDAPPWPGAAQPLDHPLLEMLEPVLDDVGAEYQNHIRGYWKQEAGSWKSRVRLFMDSLDADGLYGDPDIRLVRHIAENGDSADGEAPVSLLIRARPQALFSGAFGGAGSSVYGPVIAGFAGWKTVSQFEYEVRGSAYWGTFTRGIVPELFLSGVQDGALSMRWTLRWIDQEWRSVWPRLVLTDSTSGVSRYALPDRVLTRESLVRLSWKADARDEWSPFVHLAQHRFYTPQRDFLNRTTFEEFPLEPLLVRSVMTGVDWTRRTGGELDDLFPEELRGWRARFAVRSEAPQILGASTARLNYVLTAGAAAAAKIRPWWQAGWRAHAGIQGRWPNGQDWLYPDTIELVAQTVQDEAVSQYYRLPVAATPFVTGIPAPQFLSHHYGMLGVHQALFHKALGLWTHAAWVRDFEGPRYENRQSQNRFSLELTIRVLWQNLDFRLGSHWTDNVEAIERIKDPTRWTYFAQLGTIPF